MQTNNRSLKYSSADTNDSNLRGSLVFVSALLSLRASCGTLQIVSFKWKVVSCLSDCNWSLGIWLWVSSLGYPNSPVHWTLGEEPCLLPSVHSSHAILFFPWGSKDFLPNKEKLEVQIWILLSWLVIHSQIFTFSGTPLVCGTAPASSVSLAIMI